MSPAITAGSWLALEPDADTCEICDSLATLAFAHSTAVTDDCWMRAGSRLLDRHETPAK